MSRSFRSMLLASLIAPLISCADRTLAAVEPNQVSEVREVFDVNENRDVDFLFVIDNSHSMEREQISLADKFSNLINALEDHPDGLPSVHIGVVSTDLGGGGHNNGCSLNGDAGNFLGSDCGDLAGTFIKSIALEDGTRTTNFSGDISEVFSCMATLGTDGCGFEQPLESMRRSLSQPQAQEFLRPHAYLAVVFVTDEDDCSVRNTDMFDGAPQDLSGTLGPPKSYRCFEFGVECQEDPRTPGARTDCVPRADSEYLYDVNEYIDFLYGLKATPAQVLVATVAGELDPVDVIQRFDDRLQTDYLALDFSCTEADAEAVPPIRLSAFVDGFADDSGQRSSICEPDLSGALDDVAKLIDDKLTPCILGELADMDPGTEGVQPDCVVTETAPGQEERRLSRCDNEGDPESSTTLPCFTLRQDPEICGDTPTHLSPKVYYDEGHTVLPGTIAQASCLVGA